MARRTKEEAQKTRERILDAAVEVFYERGVATPSLTDIANLADVTRGAVYGHFRNKSDVFAALCDRIALPTEAACTSIDPDLSADPLGLLHGSWVSFFQQTAEDQQRRKILTIVFHRRELLEDNGPVYQRIRDGRQEWLTHMSALLKQAVESGQLPQDLNIETATLFFQGSVAGLLSDWLFAPHSFDLPSVSANVISGALDALRLSPAFRHTA